MDFVDAFNALEAVWWTVLAVICWVKGRGRWMAIGRIAAVILLLFAATEVVEFQTGAWWRPWSLAVAKGLCIIGLTSCGAWAWRMKLRSE